MQSDSRSGCRRHLPELLANAESQRVVRKVLVFVDGFGGGTALRKGILLGKFCCCKSFFRKSGIFLGGIADFFRQNA
jgi:hypothetical protein